VVVDGNQDPRTQPARFLQRFSSPEFDQNIRF
jgi:hypothetical protein